MRLIEVAPEFKDELDKMVKQGVDKRFRQLMMALTTEFPDVKFRYKVPGWGYMMIGEIEPHLTLNVGVENIGHSIAHKNKNWQIELDPDFVFGIELSYPAVWVDHMELVDKAQAKIEKVLHDWRTDHYTLHRNMPKVGFNTFYTRVYP